ncbi:MAG: hypothetical protein KDI56_03635 [Xanthomonadales bacterium]|nr:hypothetical protein [Xanthomonadales bacterium]
MFAWIAVSAALSLAGNSPAECSVELLVLGVAQDAGIPQIGYRDDPAWADTSQRRLATSLALLDRRSGQRYLFEATPDLRLQLQRLDEFSPPQGVGLGIDGIFLSHAHIGHYAGLMFLGRESAGSRGIAVHAMPRMAAFLRDNGPWSQLVELRNIELQSLTDGVAVALADDLQVTPLRVPHRDEYSETVGYSIAGPAGRALFIPDIDSWAQWAEQYDRRIETLLGEHDVAFLDATFYDDHELPGRDMSQIPHPRIRASMDRFDALVPALRQRVRFIHLNHSNPARFSGSDASAEIAARGYRVAQEGERVCLSPSG